MDRLQEGKFIFPGQSRSGRNFAWRGEWRDRADQLAIRPSNSFGNKCFLGFQGSSQGTEGYASMFSTVLIVALTTVGGHGCSSSCSGYGWSSCSSSCSWSKCSGCSKSGHGFFHKNKCSSSCSSSCSWSSCSSCSGKGWRKCCKSRCSSSCSWSYASCSHSGCSMSSGCTNSGMQAAPAPATAPAAPKPEMKPAPKADGKTGSIQGETITPVSATETVTYSSEPVIVYSE